jgi:hypothetical protein
VLRQADFRSYGIRVELFSESDFDRDIHAVATPRAGFCRAIDLHCRALFWLDDESFTEELFAAAETGTLLTHEVLIPGSCRASGDRGDAAGARRSERDGVPRARGRSCP